MQLAPLREKSAIERFERLESLKHPDFTQELPRKLLPTREAQSRRREKR
jgi:hypothetical protein